MNKTNQISNGVDNLIQKYDKSNMYQVILDFPKQFRIGLDSAENIKLKTKNQKLKTAIICGMGGSALPGELLKLVNANYLKAKIGINIHRNYGLPYYVSKDALIVCISYSGNTEETLSAYNEAIKQKLNVVSIASGGKLAELSQKNKTPIAIIPSNIQPRSALGYQFSALIKILEDAKLIKNVDEEILKSSGNLKTQKVENQGKKIAEKLFSKIPVIYSSQKYKALAYIWKIKFNENSKTPAFWNYFPELNHNEMVGYRNIKYQKLNIKDLFHVLILKSDDEHPKIAKRMKITLDLLKSQGILVEFIQLQGKNIWEKVFNSLVVGDWASYYLALEYGVDPTPVELTEEFKKKMTAT